MRRSVTCLAVLLTGACAVSAPTAGPEQALAEFLEIFPGRYDSALQQAQDIARDVPEAERNYRRHSIFRRVDLPAFGNEIVLAHQYRDGDPSKVYRQRLYTFVTVAERDAFRLRVHVPKDDAALQGAYRDPSLLSGLTPEDFTVWDGCDLFWRKEDDRFVGRLDPGACRFESDAFRQEIVLEETLTLSYDRITFADRGLSVGGDYLFGMRGDTPNISRKVRPFLCEMGDRTAWLHDKGGQTDRLGFPVRLEQVKGDRTGLLLTVPIQGRRDITVLAAPDAEVISMDVGQDGLTCRHAPDTLYTD